MDQHLLTLRQEFLQTMHTLLREHPDLLAPETILHIGEYIGLSSRIIDEQAKDINLYHEALERLLCALHRKKEWEKEIEAEAFRALSRHPELSKQQSIISSS